MRRIHIGKINIYNLFYDIRDFVRTNYVKLIVILIAGIAGICLGIRSGISIGDVESYLSNHRTNEYLLMAGKRGILSYFFVTAAFYAFLIIITALFSCHFLLAYLLLPLVFLRSYIFALYLSLYIIFLKITVLPYIILCLIPAYILTSIIWAFSIVSAINRAHDKKLYGSCGDNSVMEFFRKLCVPLCFLICLALITSVISYFLVLGIIL